MPSTPSPPFPTRQVRSGQYNNGVQVFGLGEPIGDLLTTYAGFALYVRKEQTEEPDLQAELDQVGT